MNGHHFATPPVLITGMSGSGLSSAARVLEDKGYYVAHNVPHKILVDLLELCAADDSPVDRVAVVSDVRTRMFPGSILETMRILTDKGMKPIILFLDARDEVLINRFDSVRRTHPLQEGDTLQEGLIRERASLKTLRDKADIIIDTSNLSVHDLRRTIEANLGSMADEKQHITIQSFGFKHGAPRDADLMVDVRFLPNPYWIPQLRSSRGTDAAVSDYVLSQEPARPFIENFLDMLYSTLKGYQHEGKSYIMVGVGCTGGHHRSVAVAEELGRLLARDENLEVNVLHRDLHRN